MVAVFSGRRRTSAPSMRGDAVDALVASGGRTPLDSAIGADGSHRTHCGVRIRRGADGAIVSVRIGRWRALTASSTRRLTEVRELGDQRVAVRIERFADGAASPTSVMWALYNLEGRLEASMQTTPDGRCGMLTNYRTRYSSWLAANANGDLRPVETWRI